MKLIKIKKINKYILLYLFIFFINKKAISTDDGIKDIAITAGVAAGAGLGISTIGKSQWYRNRNKTNNPKENFTIKEPKSTKETTIKNIKYNKSNKIENNNIYKRNKNKNIANFDKKNLDNDNLYNKIETVNENPGKRNIPNKDINIDDLDTVLSENIDSQIKTDIKITKPYNDPVIKNKPKISSDVFKKAQEEYLNSEKYKNLQDNFKAFDENQRILNSKNNNKTLSEEPILEEEL